MIKITQRDSKDPLKPSWTIDIDDEDMTKFISFTLMDKMINVGVQEDLARMVILKIFSHKKSPTESPGFEGIQKKYPLLAACMSAKYQQIQNSIEILKKGEKENASKENK